MPSENAATKTQWSPVILQLLQITTGWRKSVEEIKKRRGTELESSEDNEVRVGNRLYANTKVS